MKESNLNNIFLEFDQRSKNSLKNLQNIESDECVNLKLKNQSNIGFNDINSH